MNISKKKKAEFDNIFKLVKDGNFLININLFRNLFESNFYNNFLEHINNKILEHIKNNNIIILHIDINSLSIKDTYYYEKIINLSKILHIYTNNIKNIIIYGKSTLILNLIKIINVALETNISDKIIYSKENTYMPENIYLEE